MSTKRDRLEVDLGAQLNALLSASHVLGSRSADSFDSGLQPAAFVIARWLGSFGPAGPAAIAAGLGMDRSAVSRLVRQLGARGLVTSTPDGTDGRAVVIALSDLGSAKLRDALDLRGEVFFARTATLSDSELVELTRLLGLLTGVG
jgi:DNA-binding MarR family transcriptional regulator